MKYENLKLILIEQTKATYSVISSVVSSMTNEEYDEIPIIILTQEQLEFIRMYAVWDVPFRESDNHLKYKPYYDLYYIAPTLIKVRNENKKPL